ncbi:hypothetical protein DSUL_50184 [Desulfovibrionales bacterium]
MRNYSVSGVYLLRRYARVLTELIYESFVYPRDLFILNCPGHG